MSTPAQIGKNEYRATIIDARTTISEIRRNLKMIIHDGNSVTRAQVGIVAINLGDLDASIDRLDEIGRNTKGG